MPAAGLPGTGIGSLFYVLLVVWMPFRELSALLTGRSSWKRWRFIGFQWSMVTGVLVTLWANTWLLSHAYLFIKGFFETRLALAPTARASLQQTKALAFASAFGAFFSLGLVISTVFVLRSVVRWQKRQRAIRSATRPAAALTPALPARAAAPEAVSSTA